MQNKWKIVTGIFSLLIIIGIVGFLYNFQNSKKTIDYEQQIKALQLTNDQLNTQLFKNQIDENSNKQGVNYTYLNGMGNSRVKIFNSTGFEMIGLDHFGSGKFIGNLTVLKQLSVGTTVQGSPLYVNGTGEIATFGDGLANDKYIMFRDSVPNGIQMGLSDALILPGGFGQALIKTGTSKGFAISLDNANTFEDVTTAQFVINASGSVGIGTQRPSVILDVRGKGNFSDTILIGNKTDISIWLYNQTNASFTLWNSTWDNSFMNIWNYNQTTAGQSVYLNLSGTNANQNINFGNYNFQVNGSTFFINATTGYVGIGTTSPRFLLSTFGGDVLFNSSSSHFYFNSSAGSLAIGNMTNATGLYTFAMGANSYASSNYSFAFGNTARAKAPNSFAFGGSALAQNDSSLALGFTAYSTAPYATALGPFTTAGGQSAIAIGDSSTASGNYATALGYYTTAGGNYSMALGYKIIVNGNYSIGMSLNTTQYTIANPNLMAIMGGNVGIGTVTPAQPLNVIGDTNITGNIIGQAMISGIFNQTGCQSGFLVLGRLGCMQIAEEGTAGANAASEDCFDTYGGRLPRATELKLAASNIAIDSITAGTMEWTSELNSSGGCLVYNMSGTGSVIQNVSAQVCSTSNKYRCFTTFGN